MPLDFNIRKDLLMKKDKEKDFDRTSNDMLIIGLIYILIIFFSCYVKDLYILENQRSKAIEAMQLTIQLDKEVSSAELKNQELIQIIKFQKKYYESELKTYQKYDKIIKDIDRGWQSK